MFLLLPRDELRISTSSGCILLQRQVWQIFAMRAPHIRASRLFPAKLACTILALPVLRAAG